MGVLIMLLSLSPWLLTCQARPNPEAKPEAQPKPEAKPKPWLLGHYPVYDYAYYGGRPPWPYAAYPYNRVAQINFPGSPGFGNPTQSINGPGVSRPIIYLFHYYEGVREGF